MLENEFEYSYHSGEFPPTANIDPTTRKDYDVKIVVIDSNSRNKADFPNPSQYEYTLHESIRNVTDIELVQAFVEDNLYNIQLQNTLHVGPNEVPVVLPPGQYTFETLREKLEFILHLHGHTDIFCAFDDASKRFVFYVKNSSHCNSLSLHFRGGSTFI